jgi:hypothetical protein
VYNLKTGYWITVNRLVGVQGNFLVRYRSAPTPRSRRAQSRSLVVIASFSYFSSNRSKKEKGQSIPIPSVPHTTLGLPPQYPPLQYRTLPPSFTSRTYMSDLPRSLNRGNLPLFHGLDFEVLGFSVCRNGTEEGRKGVGT